MLRYGTKTLNNDTANSSNLSKCAIGAVNVALELDEDDPAKNQCSLVSYQSTNNNFELSPKVVNSTQISLSPLTEPIRLTWTDLTYTVIIKKWALGELSIHRKSTPKQILRPQSGEVKSGQLVGIIGPSGAGKSTLLNCLTGRYRDGLEGKVYVTCPPTGTVGSANSITGVDDNGRQSHITVAFIPQRDNLFDQFTVKETLVFASKVKNGLDFDHEAEALKVMKYLNLESCAKTYIKKCSGGQVKRVCIGVELVAHPDILVLDEPTTGLDSSTAYQCISILRKLVDVRNNPPAILCTVHQPSSKILKQFHTIYLLSKSGRCLYNGPPSGLKEHFKKAGLDCPSDYNPADFAIETAYGDYGEDVFDKLEAMTRNDNNKLNGSKIAVINRNSSIDSLNNNALNNNNGSSLGQGYASQVKITTIIKKMKSQKFPLFSHLYLLLVRNWLKIGRDPGQLYLRLFQNIAIGLMVSYLWNPDIGSEDGCWSDFLDTKSSNATDAKNLYLTKISRINANSALLFSFLIYVVMVSVMSMVLSFPTETCVIIKEMKNNWYSCGTYYTAKCLAELPILFLTILVLAAIIYPLTGQMPVLWRFGILYLVTCMMGEVCQTIGMLFGTIFSDDLISACFSSVASGFPPILFGGFVVQVSQIRWYLMPFAYMSYLRYAFESLVVTIYGFDRCPRRIASNFVEKIGKATNPVELIGTLVQNFNLTSKDASSFSVLLGVDTQCVEGIINGTIDYFGLHNNGVSSSNDDYDDYDNGTSVAVVTTPAPLYSLPKDDTSQNDESSYVLSYYSLKEDVLIPNIATLLAFILTLKCLTYYILLRKTRL